MTNKLISANNPTRRRPWPPRRRAEAAARARIHKPWRFSTGPRTGQGKARVSLNARKHGFRSKLWCDLRAVLCEQRRYVWKTLRQHRQTPGLPSIPRIQMPKLPSVLPFHPLHAML